MKLDISSVLKTENTSAAIAYNCDLSDLDLYGETPLQVPLEVSGKVQNSAGMVVLNLSAKGVIDTKCARCLKDLKVNVDLSCEYLLVTELSNADSDNDSLLLVDSGILDVDEIVRTLLILNISHKYLCKEDCKGLCPVCGKDQNEGGCNCRTKTVDPRLAVLKDLFDK